jgi:hypothetical protein
LEARYIAARHAPHGGISVNDVNIYENGILNAFNITRPGADAALFDTMLKESISGRSHWYRCLRQHLLLFNATQDIASQRQWANSQTPEHFN